MHPNPGQQDKIDRAVAKRVIGNSSDEEKAALLGHNNPPIDADPIRDRLSEDHADLLKRQAALLASVGRMPTSVDDEETAGKFGDMIKLVSACVKESEGRRVMAKEPYLQGGRTVDGFFKKVSDPLEDAKKIILKPLDVFNKARSAAERRRLDDVARLQREQAEKEAKEAAEKAEALKNEDDLEAAVAAEDAARIAAEAAQKAEKEAQASNADLSRTRGDHGSVSSLRTRWVHDEATLDRSILDLEALRSHIPQDALDKAVRSFIKAGGRDLKGAHIYERTDTVVA